MTDADRLRAQIPASTDPERLERMARQEDRDAAAQMPTDDNTRECARRLREWFFSDDPRVTGVNRWFAPELEAVLDYADKKLKEAADDQ